MEEGNSSRNSNLYSFGPFRLDPVERKLLNAGVPMPLSRKLFDLLLILVTEAGRLKTREELIQALWPHNIVAEHGLTNKLYALRKALGDDGDTPAYIETVHGIGYRFIAPVTRETRPQEAPSDNPQPRRRIRLAIGIGALLALAGLAVGITFWVSATQQGQAVESIAVLPFENLSADQSNAYLAAGIQEEILTHLASIQGLEVISGNSTRSYQSHPHDLKRIAQELGVDHVLEGSVQKAGNRVKVNVQLIDADTHDHIWARDYTRELTDIFGVEGDISKSVADALGTVLTEAKVKELALPATSNPAAHDAYLRGLSYANRPADNFENESKAVAYFTQAVTLDPDFAVAWARLSLAHSNMYYFGFEHTPGRMQQAREAASRALKLAPRLGVAWLAEGEYQLSGLGDPAAARRAFETARRYLPNSAEVLNHISYLERSLGHWEKAIAAEERAARLDPRNARTIFQWGLSYVALRRFAQAQTLFNRALNLAPDNSEVIAILAATYQAQGDLATAGKVLTALPAHPGGFHAVCVQANQLLYERRYAEAGSLLRAALARPTAKLGGGIGYYYTLLGLALLRSGDGKGARETYLEGRAVLRNLHRAGDNSFWLLDNLARMEAGLGHADAARLLAEQAQAVTEAKNWHIYEPSTREELARINAQLGDAPSAVALLSRLLKTPYGRFLDAVPITAAALRLDPAWDPIRRHPAFQTLLKKYPVSKTLQPKKAHTAKHKRP